MSWLMVWATLGLASEAAPDQVFVEALLVEVCGVALEGEVSLQAPPGSDAMGVAQLALRELDAVTVVSAPNLLTLDGVEARIAVGQEVPVVVDSTANKVRYDRVTVPKLSLAVTPGIHGHAVETDVAAQWTDGGGQLRDLAFTAHVDSGESFAMALPVSGCRRGTPSSAVVLFTPTILRHEGDMADLVAAKDSERLRYHSTTELGRSARAKRLVRRALVEVSGLGALLAR